MFFVYITCRIEIKFYLLTYLLTSHNVVHLALFEIQTHNISGDRH